MNRIELIRNEEKKYHDYCYDNYKLFEKGFWLYKPVKTVMESIASLEGKGHLNVLDLGAGVGRNSIPIAEKIKGKGGKVVCVDLLDSAIEKLIEYSKKFDVEDIIEIEKADIGKYSIKEDEYDLIVAVSSLEHVSAENILDSVLNQMAQGTKKGGINCIIINSEVEEIEIESNKQLDAFMEINLTTDQMIDKLKNNYKGWEVVKQLVRPLEYQIVRNENPVLLKSKAITFVVQKNSKEF
ncbi:methyltransferase domain-containing protein [Gracilibacillus salitolerans]|uniref:Methyltransferase domain-containing protein n=1 Tax=Gracilibacillus salitolerans TaxID=2663022 RepID=A0A5Q2TDS8_9BACI|nr:class I SAM-dependent methyltransferase [Gracilibacillus salitolerans]QGH32874.1 methyltransferase domain-containing protein [Gracilibacillus salitolerans]